jgi:hypothetical protein
MKTMTTATTTSHVAHRRNSVLVALCLVMVVAGSITAQTPIPPTIRSGEDQTKQRKIVLDKDARLLADEYADLLRQLQDVVKDYSGYLQDEQSTRIRKYRESLLRLKDMLAGGVYVEHTDKLSADLYLQLEELSSLESEIRESSEVYSMRTYRLIKSLHRELAGINDLVDNDLTERLGEQEEYQKAIEDYVRAVLANISVQVQTAPDGQTTVIVQNPKGWATAPKPSGSKRVKIVEVPTHPEGTAGAAVVPVPPIPDDSGYRIVVPVPPTATAPPVPQEARSYGKTIVDGVEKEFDDSIEVVSPKGSVRVDNKMGEITVVGSGTNYVKAYLVISYKAESRSMEKQFANMVKLTVQRVGDNYTVTSSLPRLEGSGVKIGSSELVVELPARHPLLIANSFGSVEVTDMQADVEVTSSYSQIDVSNVSGAVKIASTTGEVSLSEVKGKIKISNSFAPITISSCRGDMDIVGTYCPVTISESRGTVTLRNSGAVEVTDHTGDLTLDNSFGPIEVRDIRGSVSATNKFQPVTVSSVRGAVSIEGMNSPIELSDISGSVVANTRFGQITAEDLQGPITLSNQGGNITVTLGDEFHGSSSITSTAGNISLGIPEGINLLVSAKTTAGSISSFKPLRLTEDGFNKSGTLRLGSGRDSLKLVATNASINIDSK